jgi:hypothetical protein
MTTTVILKLVIPPVSNSNIYLLRVVANFRRVSCTVLGNGNFPRRGATRRVNHCGFLRKSPLSHRRPLINLNCRSGGEDQRDTTRLS